MAHKVTAQTELQRNWFTISSLVSKDFKLKYRRSVLGVAWSVLNPLLMMCVLAAVFTNVLKFGDVANFPMYLILGERVIRSDVRLNKHGHDFNSGISAPY